MCNFAHSKGRHCTPPHMHVCHLSTWGGICNPRVESISLAAQMQKPLKGKEMELHHDKETNATITSTMEWQSYSTTLQGRQVNR